MLDRSHFCRGVRWQFGSFSIERLRLQKLSKNDFL